MEELLGNFIIGEDNNSHVNEDTKEKIVFVSDDENETIFKFVEKEEPEIVIEKPNLSK